MVLIRKNYHFKKSVSPKNLWMRPCCLYKGFDRRFLLEVFEKFLPKTLTWELFLNILWFALFAFSKNILVHVVTVGDLAKFSMQTSATAKTKSCSFNNNEFHCCLGACFQGFKKFEEIFRFIYLECFFLWCVFFKWQKMFLSISISCYIFRVFRLWYFD